MTKIDFRHLSTALAVTLGLTLVGLAAAPVEAQERATLVNPKKKTEPDVAEPAPDRPEVAPPAAEPSEPVEPEPAEAEAEAKAEPEAEAKAEPEAKAEAAPRAEAETEERPAPATEPEPAEAEAEARPAAEPRAAAEPEPEATESSAAEPAAPARADRRPEPAATPDRERERPTRTADVVQERITVTEVLLDVLVTDRAGNVVTGLGPEDFVVLEQGEEQEITDVVFYGTPEELKSPGIEGDTRSDRYFILLFHDQRQIEPALMAAQIDAARRTQKWIEEELLPNDQVAVLGYDVKLKVYQDFTRDAEAIKKAVEAAALGKRAPAHYKTRSGPEFDPDSPSLLVNLPADPQLGRETRNFQEALGLIGRAAEGIVGRKNLILFSVGYGEIFVGGIPEWTPDPRFYPDMKQSLNAGNVAVYSIDWLGAMRGGIGGARLNDSLSSISNDTGGHYYYNFTNVMTPLQQVADDNQGYYLLSYRTEFPTGDSGYREVTVKTDDPSHRVRARQGYRYGTN